LKWKIIQFTFFDKLSTAKLPGKIYISAWVTSVSNRYYLATQNTKKIQIILPWI